MYVTEKKGFNELISFWERISIAHLRVISVCLSRAVITCQAGKYIQGRGVAPLCVSITER